MDRIDLSGIDERSDLGTFIQAVSELELLGFLEKTGNKLILDLLVKDQATRGSTTLSRGPERAPEDTFGDQRGPRG